MITCKIQNGWLTAGVTPVYVKDAATSATLTVQAADPNKHPRIYGVVITTDLAGTYTLKIGATVVAEFYLGANSGYGQNFHPFYLSNGTVNEAVTLTKPAGANTSVTAFLASVP